MNTFAAIVYWRTDVAGPKHMCKDRKNKWKLFLTKTKWRSQLCGRSASMGMKYWLRWWRCRHQLDTEIMSDSDRTVVAASVPQQHRAGSSTHPRRTRIGRCVANCFCRTMKEMTLRSGLAGLRHIEMASWVLETPMMLLEYCSGSLGLGRAMTAAAA